MAIQDLTFSLFFLLLERFGILRDARRSPKELQDYQNGAQNEPQGHQKRLERAFNRNSQNLDF